MRKLLIGLMAIATVAAYGFRGGTGTATEFEKAAQKALEKYSDAIVFVTASVPQQQQQGRGMMRGRRQPQQRMVQRPFTGVLLDKEGTIIIEAHSMPGEGELEDIKVTLVAEKDNSYSAEFLMANRSYNLCFIKISEEELKERKPELKPVTLGRKVGFTLGQEFVEVGRQGPSLDFVPAVLRGYVHTVVDSSNVKLNLITAHYAVRPYFDLSGEFVGVSVAYILHTPDMGAHTLYTIIDPDTLEKRYTEMKEEMKEIKN